MAIYLSAHMTSTITLPLHAVEFNHPYCDLADFPRVDALRLFIGSCVAIFTR